MTDPITQQIKNHFSPIALHFSAESTLFIKSYLNNHAAIHQILDLASYRSIDAFTSYIRENKTTFHNKVVLLWNLSYLFDVNDAISLKALYASILHPLKEHALCTLITLQNPSDESLLQNYFIPYHMYFSWVERHNLIMRIVCFQQRDINSKRITKRRYMRFPETKTQELQWLVDYAEVQAVKQHSESATSAKQENAAPSAIQKERQQQKQDSLERVQMDSTFNLETSEREAKQRDALVLPHQRIGQQKTVSKVRARGAMIQIENEESDEDSDFDTDEEPDDDEEI